MSAKILDGRVVRDEIKENLKSQISLSTRNSLKASNLKSRPKLVIIQVGDVAESNTYISGKIKFGESIGAVVEHKKFPATISQKSLISQISILNSDSSVHGIIVQMPIPEHLNKEAIIDTIDPKKDVDGLTTTNQQLLENNDPQVFIPATAKAVITILNYYKIPIEGKKAAVVGRSKLVGAPVAILLRNLGAQVEVGHSQTPDLTAVTKPADIVVVAVGKPNLITKNHVSPDQTVIDVGINVIDSNARLWKTEKPGIGQNQRHLTGDVNFAEVEPIVAAITPVPGGIGPLTIASLFENLLEAYKKQS